MQTDNGIQQVPPEQVKVGEIILVRPGEKVPLDGEVLSGHSNLDTSALTGESVPLSTRMGDTLMAGTINLTASLKLRVTKPFNESSIAKVLELVENASARKAPTENFITSFAAHMVAEAARWKPWTRITTRRNPVHQIIANSAHRHELPNKADSPEPVYSRKARDRPRG